MKLSGSGLQKLLDGGILVAAAVLLMMTVSTATERLSSPTTAVRPGEGISLRDMDWTRFDRTLILAVQPKCGFTEASLPFYRELLRVLPATVHAVLVTPYPVAVGTQIANEYSLTISDIRQATFAALQVPGSPTLLLADARGRLLQSWVGALSRQKEESVFSALGTQRPTIGQAPSSSFGYTAANTLFSQHQPTILDTRDRDDVLRAPIQDSVSIPLNELEARLVHEVPRARSLLAICDYCLDCVAREKVLPSRCDVVGRILTHLGFSDVTLVGTIQLNAMHISGDAR